MKRKCFFIPLWAWFFLCLPAGLLVWFFFYFQSVANDLKQKYSLDAASANAVKHAYAAAQIYQVINAVGVSQESSQQMVFMLGAANEYVEHFIRAEAKRDSNAEMMKDLFNNYVGILANNFYKSHVDKLPEKDLLAFFVTLAKHNVLITSVTQKSSFYEDNAALLQQSSNVALCVASFDDAQGSILKYVQSELVALYP